MRFVAFALFVILPCMALELPQVQTLGAGFDAVQAKQTIPIVALTFSTNTWVNPFGNTTAYSVPDQVYVANRYGMKTDTNLYYTSTNYSQGLAQEYGLGFDKLGNWFKPEVQKKEQELDQSQKTFSKISQHLTMFQATLLPTSKLTLTDSFKQAVDALPNWYNYEQIKSFFEFIGTHVIVDIVVGGQSEYHTYGESSYLSSGTGFLLGGNAKVGFGIVKSNFGGQFSRSQVSNSFSSYAQSNYVRSGGNPEIPQGDWHSWVKTVPTNPVVLKRKLVPVTEFIADGQRRNLVEQALEEYSTATITPAPNKKQTITTGQCDCEEISPKKTHWCSNGKVITRTYSQDGYSAWGASCCKLCTSWSQNGFGSVRSRAQVSKTVPQMPQEKLLAHQKFVEKRSLINAAHRGTGLSKCGSHECLPGLDSFGIGFDALTGDLKNIGFFDWTYRGDKTYTDPFDTSITYSYPDQLTIESSPVTSSNTMSFNTSKDYIKQLSEDVGLGFDFPFFGLSAQAKFAESVFTGQQAVYVEHKDEFGYYSLTLPPPSQLTQSDVLKEALAALPDHPDYAAYARFVNRFGTHFISKSHYGGRVKMNTYVDSRYAQQSDYAALIFQVKTLLEAFKLDFSANVTSTSGFADFVSSSFSEVYLEGGNFEDFQIQDYAQWLKSVHLAPIQISYSLTPIASLIPDQRRQSFMKTFLQYYYNQIAVPEQPPVTFLGWYNGGSTGSCSLAGGLMTGFSGQRDNEYFLLPVMCESYHYYFTNRTENKPVTYTCTQVSSFWCPHDQFMAAMSVIDAFTGYYGTSPITCCKVSLSIEQPSMIMVSMNLPPSPPYNAPDQSQSPNGDVSGGQPSGVPAISDNMWTYIYVGAGCVGLIGLLVCGILLHRKLKKKHQYQELN